MRAKRNSALRVAARALRSTVARPWLVLTLALALTAARLILHRPGEALALRLAAKLFSDTSALRQLAVLAVSGVLALALTATVAGAVFGAAARGWPFFCLAERMRRAPAFFAAALAGATGFATALGAELAAVLSVAARAGTAQPAHVSALLFCAGLACGALALLCAASALLALVRLGVDQEGTPGTMGTGLLALGEAALALLARPIRALTLVNAALLITLPLALAYWVTLPWIWTAQPKPAGILLLMLAQGLCMAAALITTALTIETGLRPWPGENRAPIPARDPAFGPSNGRELTL